LAGGAGLATLEAYTAAAARSKPRCRRRPFEASPPPSKLVSESVPQQTSDDPCRDLIFSGPASDRHRAPSAAETELFSLRLFSGQAGYLCK
jgi:hypothetical protein